MATTRHMRMYPRPKLVIRISQSGMRRVMGFRIAEFGIRISSASLKDLHSEIRNPKSQISYRHRHLAQDLLHHLPLPAAGTESIGGDREDSVSEDGVGHGLRVVGRGVVAPLHKG